MTDYTHLIARLRLSQTGGIHYEAADALEAQARRIADLSKEADMMHSEYKTACARIAELEAAIDLFIAYDETDDEDMVAMVQCYDAAIEAARKVLRSGEKNDNE